MEQINIDPKLILSEIESSTTIDLKLGVATALLGENGAGKSTFFHALKNYLNKTPVFKNNSSFLDQLPLSPITQLRGVDFLEAIIDFCSKRIKIKNVNDYTLVDEFKFRDHLIKPIDELSGGENQTLKILGTFILDVEYYFLDEPNHYLDQFRKEVLKKYILSLLKQNRSFFIIEHDQDFVNSVCTKSYFLMNTNRRLTLNPK